mmetsp:Transcript_34722/g.72827  ORF Transcript_34722/g.72827 Transcript_34722/m.72827 type:complete len:318 (-) Transcript_34722:39-992(-)
MASDALGPVKVLPHVLHAIASHAALPCPRRRSGRPLAVVSASLVLPLSLPLREAAAVEIRPRGGADAATAALVVAAVALAAALALAGEPPSSATRPVAGIQGCMSCSCRGSLLYASNTRACSSTTSTNRRDAAPQTRTRCTTSTSMKELVGNAAALLHSATGQKPCRPGRKPPGGSTSSQQYHSRSLEKRVSRVCGGVFGSPRNSKSRKPLASLHSFLTCKIKVPKFLILQLGKVLTKMGACCLRFSFHFFSASSITSLSLDSVDEAKSSMPSKTSASVISSTSLSENTTLNWYSPLVYLHPTTFPLKGPILKTFRT